MQKVYIKNISNLAMVLSAIKTHPTVQRTYHSLIHLVSDCYLISFPKSGRTWVRLLIGQCLHLHYGYPLNLDLYKMTLFTNTPNIKTDPRPKSYSSKAEITPPSSFSQKKIILLVRNPKDVIVSYYFEWSKRREKAYTNEIHSFIREPYTFPHLIDFMNVWAEEYQRNSKKFVLIRYENFHSNPIDELRKVFNFLGINIPNNIIHQAIEKCKFDKMQKMEEKRAFGKDHRFMPTSSGDKESYKMRRGIVGGYVDYLSSKDCRFLDSKLINLNFLYTDYINKSENFTLNQ